MPLEFHLLEQGEHRPVKPIPVYHLPAGRTSEVDISVALHALHADTSGNVITVVGGAAGAQASDRLNATVDGAVRAARACNATVVYGGTASGVLEAQGRAVRQAREGMRHAEADIPLVAVVARGTVTTRFDNAPTEVNKDAAPLQADMDLLITTPGSQFGDESLAIAQTSGIMSRFDRSATLLYNGGLITKADALNALTVQNPHDHVLFVVRDSDRLADEIAAVHDTGRPSNDPIVNRIAFDPRTLVVTPDHVEHALTDHLGAPVVAPRPKPAVPELNPSVQLRSVHSAAAGLTAMNIGRMTTSGYGRRDALNIRDNVASPLVDPAAHKAWVAAPEGDRIEALDRLAREAGTRADTMTPSQAFRMGAQLEYWRQHDYYLDHAHPQRPPGNATRPRDTSRSTGPHLAKTRGRSL
ncbi:MAG TPA: hypothetical protein VLH10_25915 [Yinghuangia sp.]|nr:hypothetical protein [Yinghuangia sp.]